MHLVKGFLKAMLFISILPMVSCNQPDSSAHKTASTPKATDDNFVNFYTWNDYLQHQVLLRADQPDGASSELARWTHVVWDVL